MLSNPGTTRRHVFTSGGTGVKRLFNKNHNLAIVLARMEGPCRDDRCRLTLARTTTTTSEQKFFVVLSSRQKPPTCLFGYILYFQPLSLPPPSFVDFLLLLPLPISPFSLPCRTGSSSPRKCLSPSSFSVVNPSPMGIQLHRWNSSGTRIGPMRRQDEIDRKDDDDIDDEQNDAGGRSMPEVSLCSGNGFIGDVEPRAARSNIRRSCGPANLRPPFYLRLASLPTGYI